MDRRDAVLTFHQGTPPHIHTLNIMTTTNIHPLSDHELEQVSAGFLGRLVRWVARGFKRVPRVRHQEAQRFGPRRVDSFDYTEVNL